MSSATYGGPGGGKAPECDEECAEEECDPDQCGDEARGPRPEHTIFGIDTRPVLPIGLLLTTVAGVICMSVCQLPVLASIVGAPFWLFIPGWLILSFVALGTTWYCIWCDPGQLKRGHASQQALVGSPGGSQNPAPLPKRTHKAWLYKQPIRRYDHYCRWVTNCIGLRNHREFMVMCATLILMALIGMAVDLVVTIGVIANQMYALLIIVLCHLVYSVVLLALVGPILKIHLGLVSRNELAAEWKRNEFYVADTGGKHGGYGERVPVNELSDDEFNALFDSFVYDKRRNRWDKGMVENCTTFWCTPRDAPGELGEF